ncbi:MAG: hypothetical protein C5B50_06425 [Verrucomicrobia bacterium]|nr:MAG: hypothetical protein C5B50_06425 [Verrucomicrobiota bacterium]
MYETEFEEAIKRIRAKDNRYDPEAYWLVRKGLDYTQDTLGRGRRGRSRHVSGQELLKGLRDYMLAQYGPMALMLLEEWGVRSCGDFGEIVFSMIEAGLLGKTDKDCRADFEGGYDFIEAFRKPFLPQSTQPARQTTPGLIQPDLPGGDTRAWTPKPHKT